jgi:peptidyl-tRNA hydrolase, PTH2 family
MKQVIIVDDSLHLPKGKLAAQVAHAALAAFLECDEYERAAWLQEGMPKVVLRVNSGAALMELYEKALQDGIPAVLIEDAGRTVVPSGTITCLGLGPADDARIDAISGGLRLL